jgi:hypothetical protein
VTVAAPCIASGEKVCTAKVEMEPPEYWTTSPSEQRVATSFVPKNVTTAPPEVIAWPLITTELPLAAAEMIWPATVATAVEAGDWFEEATMGFPQKLDLESLPTR